MTRMIDSAKKFLSAHHPAPESALVLVGVTVVTIGAAMKFDLAIALIVLGAFILLPFVVAMFTPKPRDPK